MRRHLGLTTELLLKLFKNQWPCPTLEDSDMEDPWSLNAVFMKSSPSSSVDSEASAGGIFHWDDRRSAYMCREAAAGKDWWGTKSRCHENSFSCEEPGGEACMLQRLSGGRGKNWCGLRSRAGAGAGGFLHLGRSWRRVSSSKSCKNNKTDRTIYKGCAVKDKQKNCL